MLQAMDRRFLILVLAAAAMTFAAVWFWTGPATPGAEPAIVADAPDQSAAPSIPAANPGAVVEDTTPLPPPSASEIPR